MKVLILGAHGMLGAELVRQLVEHEVYSFDSDLDVTDRLAIQSKIEELKPEVIFNCVAYNAVDKAEGEGSLMAQALNADAVGYIAEAANKVNATLVHYSTGFVFDGENAEGYNEADAPNPQSVYAKTKYEGELQAQKSSKYYLVRLNLLFGKAGTGKNSKQGFPDLILEQVKEKNEFDFVTDEVSTPTYSKDLVEASLKLVQGNYPYGVYHLPNEGRASWFEFAAEVFKDAGVNAKMNATTSDKFVRPAKRPHYSVINNNKFPKLRRWQEALKDYLNS